MGQDFGEHGEGKGKKKLKQNKGKKEKGAELSPARSEKSKVNAGSPKSARKGAQGKHVHEGSSGKDASSRPAKKQKKEEQPQDSTKTTVTPHKPQVRGKKKNASGLTALQENMKSTLDGARFRWESYSYDVYLLLT